MNASGLAPRIFTQQDPDFPGDVLLIGLGEFAPGMSFHQGANRAFGLHLTNEGNWSAPGGGEDSPFGTYDGEGVNDLTIVANAHAEEALNYDGPLGSHTLPPFTYSVYLNGLRVVEEQTFINQFQLGKLAFMTGLGGANADVDFLIDDLQITGLREMEFVEFVLDYPEDFEEQTIGERPSGSFYARPNDVDVGLEVVGPETAITSINGKSLRLYDESGGNRAVIEDNFVPGADSFRPDVRFDFSFRRSAASELTGINHVLYASLGGIGSGMFLHTNARRAMEVRIGNDGNIRVGGSSLSAAFRFEDLDEIGTHHISFFANAQADSVSFKGPDGEQRELNGFSFTVFLNGEILDENNGFRTDINGVILVPDLGRWGFVTGGNAAATGIDFVIDDIRVSQFLGDDEPAVDLPPLQITKAETAGNLILSWSSAGDTNYRIHRSEDLETWTPLGEINSGTGDTIEVEVSMGEAARGFFRLVLEN